MTHFPSASGAELLAGYFHSVEADGDEGQNEVLLQLAALVIEADAFRTPPEKVMHLFDSALREFLRGKGLR